MGAAAAGVVTTGAVAAAGEGASTAATTWTALGKILPWPLISVTCADSMMIPSRLAEKPSVSPRGRF
jgi:hypothetical protein